MQENVFNQSIWGDEGFSAILSMRPIPEIITIIMRDTSPPLWNIFEYFVFQTLGTDEIYIRSLSLVFFLGAVYFTYCIGAFLFSKKTGAIAALLTALNPFFFTYAFEGRMYSIMSLGVAGSMYFYIRILYNEEFIRKRDKAGYVFFTLWALYSHHFAIFAVFIQGLWWLYELALGKRIRAKKMLKLFLLTGLLYTPWLYPLYTQTRQVAGGFWLGTPTFDDLKKLIYEYLAEGIKRDSLKAPYLEESLFHISLYIVWATIILRKWWKNIKKSIFFILWFLGPILITWLVSQKFQSIFYNRYILYTIPAAMLLLASSRSKYSIIPITCLSILFAIIDYDYFTNPTKLPFREYSETVKADLRSDDFLINWSSNGTHHIWETKYYGIGAPIYIPEGSGNLPFFVGTALMMEGDIIRNIPPGTERIGVITSGPVEEVEVAGYEIDEVKTVDKLKILWLEKEN